MKGILANLPLPRLCPNGLIGHSAYPTNTAILQRVLSASVTVDQKVVSSIGNGILVFAAMAPGDTEKDAERLASKILKLKLWDDESGGRWKRSVQDISGEVLCGEHACTNRI
jgi:D-tyrosyl-tRNA(Tyr) deacylase